MSITPEIVLTWNANTPAPQGYNIYRGTTRANVPAPGTSPLNGATLLTSPTYTDLNVFPGQTYWYAVTAVNFGIESADSLLIESAPVPYPFSPASPFLPPGLDNFEILAGSTITNSGATTIGGDIGVYPGTSITGFPPGIVAGVIHSADFVAQTGQAAAQVLFNELAAVASNTPVSGDIGGQTLIPGVYTSSSTLGVTGTLTLDAAGNPNAVWIFQIGSALTTAVGNSEIVLLNGAQASNVYWQVGTSATLGGSTGFIGTVIAQASISVGTGAQVSGRLFALVGAITLLDNAIILFDSAPFVSYGPGLGVGDVIYDCASGTFEEVVAVTGPVGATYPTFPSTAGIYTTDGGVIWFSISPNGVTLNLPLPPSPPNVPPAAPTAPTGLQITLEQ